MENLITKSSVQLQLQKNKRRPHILMFFCLFCEAVTSGSMQRSTNAFEGNPQQTGGKQNIKIVRFPQQQ